MTQPTERYELIISIEPAHEEYPSMQAAIAALSEQYAVPQLAFTHPFR